MNLEDSSKHMKILQHELNMLLNKPTFSIGIQTDQQQHISNDDDFSVDSYFTAFESPLIIRKNQSDMEKQIELWLNHIDYTKSRDTGCPQI
jgi:hypothetical protein